MQQRSIFYTSEQIYSADLLGAQVYSLIGHANDLQVTLGQTGSYISNLILSPTLPASLTLNLTNGFLASLQPVDASSYGSLSANTQQVLQLAFNTQTNVVINNTLEAGQAQYVLIEAGFQMQDSNAVVLNYVNLSNPAVPLNGPGNSGIAQDTIRNEIAVITVKYGTPATSGSEVPPVVDSGNVAIAYVDLEAGQTTITSGQILDPTSVVNETGHGSPTQILAGLLNSHHSGAIGQAPKIILTSGTTQEVQGELPTANMVASNSTGAVATWRNGSGNPNGSVAGNANTNGAADMYYDTTNLLLYVCTTTGNSASAVWTSVAAPLPNNLVYFGSGAVGALSNSNPAPTSGTLTGNYYTSGPWVQTGPITLNRARLYFGGSVTFNNTVTVTPGIEANQPAQNTSPSIGYPVGYQGNGQGLGGGSTGGGGGGFGGVGGYNFQANGSGDLNSSGGFSYTIDDARAGSAGGLGSDYSNLPVVMGGAGGGSCYIEAAGAVIFASGCNFTANGGNGNANGFSNISASGGGGGSGGSIEIRSTQPITIASGATISANGGNGGACGAGSGGASGGGGYIRLRGYSVTNNGTITVSAGANGGGGGSPVPGAVGVVDSASVVWGTHQ